MNAKFFKYTLIAILVVAVAAGIFALFSRSSQEPAVIPNTGISFPANVTGELDVSQMDEQAKLEALPVTFPSASGELDVSQMDERAKLGTYPIYFPPETGELDVSQMDEKAKLGS